MKKIKFLTAGLIAAMMIPAAAQAQTGELRRDRQDIRQDQRDLRNAQRYGDHRDVRDARKDVRDSKREYREDVRDWRRDARYQNYRAPFRYQQFRVGSTLREYSLSGRRYLGRSLPPFKGDAENVNALLAGHIKSSVSTNSIMTFIESGKVRPLAIASEQRSPAFPNLPTFKEQGVPGFEQASSWYAAYVPTGTPAAVVSQLEKAMIHIVQDSAFAAKMAQGGMVTTGRPGAEVTSLIKSQREA